MQTFPVPKNSQKEWTEWFKGFNGDPTRLNDPNYNEALGEVDTWIKSTDGMPTSAIADVDRFMQGVSAMPVTDGDVQAYGSGWGAVEELRLGRPLVPGLTFSLPADPARYST
jgi:hypothetical protein